MYVYLKNNRKYVEVSAATRAECVSQVVSNHLRLSEEFATAKARELAAAAAAAAAAAEAV